LRDLFDTDSFEVVLNSDDDSVNYLNTNDEELLEKIHKDFADYKSNFSYFLANSLEGLVKNIILI